MEALLLLWLHSIRSVTDSANFITSLELLEFISLFWAFFCLELPRYCIADVYVFYRVMRGLETPTPAPNSGHVPRVSIIMSVLNEGDTLEASVRSLHEQNYPNIDIVVVDDGSTDNTASVCKRLAAERLIRFFPSRQRQGKASALNYGCRMAGGEYIVFMDSDSTLDREAVRQILGKFTDDSIGAVGGNIGVRNTYTNLLTRLQTVEYLTSITVGRIFRAHCGILGIISGAFGAFPRHLIERVGLHEPGPGNDSDLTIRVRKLGKQIAFAPAAICLTNVPTAWPKWFKQRLRWNRNVVRNRLRKHKDTFNIWSENFSWTNLLSFMDTVFFSFILTFLWAFYILYLIVSDAHDYFWTIMLMNYMLYATSKFAQILLALIVSGRIDEDVRLLLISICMPAYKIAEKLVRLTAYLQELLFRASYRDPFAPEKVQRQMNQY